MPNEKLSEKPNCSNCFKICRSVACLRTSQKNLANQRELVFLRNASQSMYVMCAKNVLSDHLCYMQTEPQKEQQSYILRL